ncbi:MAG TPA: hypothetical protein VD837_14640 [Terriglobales bacterium]|nr:hypothetical protein [Terriglobales bacterium]
MAIVQHSSAPASSSPTLPAPPKLAQVRGKATVPVILFEGALTGAAAARILNQRGIQTYSVANDPGIYAKSRYYRRLPGIAERTDPSELESLLRATKVRNAVLMPCADDWLQAIGTVPADENSDFKTCLPPRAAIETVVDKAGFATAVREFGVPHPRTRIIRTLEELQKLGDDEFQGYFLKPIHSLEFSRKHGVKALLVQDKTTALASAQGVNLPILLQEYIPGPATAHYFLDGFIDRHGRTCALFARRRLRMYPPKLGNSTLMVSIPLQQLEAAAEPLVRLLNGLNYRGIFSAEFKFDERDSTFKILEINARPWWYVEFAARCGVDVCTMAYHDALGIDIHPVTSYAVGRRCVHLSLDISAFMRRSEGFPTSWLSWAKSVAGAYDALFRWSDPGPAIAYNLNTTRRRWRT